MKWKLDPRAKIKPPSIAQIRHAIKLEIDINGSSGMERDGIVRDKAFIHAIVCLRAALPFIKRRKVWNGVTFEKGPPLIIF